MPIFYAFFNQRIVGKIIGVTIFLCTESLYHNGYLPLHCQVPLKWRSDHFLHFFRILFDFFYFYLFLCASIIFF